MKWHCGLLSERPENDRTLNYIKRPIWGHLPPEIEHELRIWLAMPGFSISYHTHTLRQGRSLVERNIGGYDQYRNEVAENWLSATREDCIKLARLRPGLGDVPVICQARALQDMKTMTVAKVARDYGVKDSTVTMWRKVGFRCNQLLPSGFELLSR